MPTVNVENTKKHERKQRRHFLDVNLTGLSGTLALYLLGEDLAELNRERTYNTESVRNILGVMTTTTTLGEETISELTVVAREDDPLTDLCEHLDETRAEYDSLKRWYYEAKIDGDGNTIRAFKQVADCKVTRVGGTAEDPDGFALNITLSGAAIPQEYDFATDTFTNTAP